MSRIVSKVFISLAFGLLVGTIVAYVNKEETYYLLENDRKTEITYERYSDSNDYRRKVEISLNKTDLLFYTSIVSSVTVIALLVPELRRKVT